MRIADKDRDETIARLYQSGKYMTSQLASLYGVSARQIQRIAARYGVIRTQAESNKSSAPLKHYKKIPAEMRVQRKHISRKVRYALISNHPYCTVCGMKPGDGVQLEVDHIDNNPTNNEPSNLQVLCNACNIGKAQLDRHGIANK